MADYESEEELLARRERLVRRIEAIDAAAEILDEDQRASWNSLNEQVQEVDDLLSQRRRRQERLAELSRDPRHVVDAVEGSARRPDPAGDSAPAHVRQAHVGALWAIERHRDILPSGAGDELERVVRHRDPRGIASRYIAAVAHENYASAFAKMVGDPAMAHLKFSSREVEAVRLVTEVEAERALATTTTGVPIPFQLDPSLIYAGSGSLNPLRQICRVETVTEGTWKGVNTQDVSLSYSAEAAEAADNTPTLAQPSVTTQRCIGFIPFSIEAGQDWPTLVEELGAALRDGKDILDATAFLTGTGSNQPGGILNIGGTGGLTTTQRVQTNTSATYALADVYKLKQAIPARFFNRSTFVAHPAIWDTTFRFTGGNSAEPLLLPTRDGAVIGMPKVELSTMVVTTTTGSKIMMAGDFRTGYLIADRLGGSIELAPHLFGATNRFPTGQRGLVAIWRTGGGVVAANSLRYMEVL
jgi:HK97 family phage major capsid protein